MNLKRKSRRSIYKRGSSVTTGDLRARIRLRNEVEKSFTPLGAVSLTPEGHLEYLHVVLQLEKEYDGELEMEAVTFRMRNNYEEEGLGLKYIESSPVREIYEESSDAELDTGSIDSIARNVDFIAF